MLKRLSPVVIAAVVAILLAACGGGDESEGKARSLGDLRFSDHGMKSVQGKTEIALEADSYYFEPTFIQGESGQTLKLKIENESATIHNITVKAQSIDQDIPAKGKVTVDVAIPQSGALLFFLQISHWSRHER